MGIESSSRVELPDEHGLGVLVVLIFFRDRVKCKLIRMSSRVISTELAGAWVVNPKVFATSR